MDELDEPWRVLVEASMLIRTLSLPVCRIPLQAGGCASV